ncbi:MAG: hypothetical protein AABZ43_01980 [Planctomycetota bacterium]
MSNEQYTYCNNCHEKVHIDDICNHGLCQYCYNERNTIEDEIKCPKCRSTQITVNKKGFGLVKAATGGILLGPLLGPVGLLGGLIGSNKIVITCLKCGHTWKAGQA